MKRGLMGAGAVSLALLGVPALANAASLTPPYHDLAAKGSITLCDGAGHSVTSGSIYDKPFVWRAVSSTAAVPPWRGAKATAILAAYQPRSTTYPDQWNGDTLTADARYTDPNHPTAVATPLDFRLADYLHEYPASWDGWVQLRMFLGAPNTGPLVASYPTADIHVSGTTWTLVTGGGGTCNTLPAVSSEVFEAHLNTNSAPSPGSTTPVGSTSLTRGGSSTSPSGSASTGASGGSSGAANQADANNGSTPSSSAVSSGAGKGWIVALLVVVAGAVALVVMRRRRAV